MGGIRRRAGAAAVCLLLALVPAAGAASRWGSKETVFAPGHTDFLGIDLALGPHGDALAITEGDKLYLARSRNRGHFRISSTFPNEYAFPTVGFVNDSGGRRIVLLFDDGEENTGLYARTELPNGDFGPREAIDPRPDRLLDELIFTRSPTGDVVLVWGSSSAFCACLDQLRVCVRRAGEDHFGPPQTLSPPGRAAYDPQIAFDHRGDALVAWAQFHDVNRGQVAYSMRPAGGNFGPLHKLPAAGRHGSVESLRLGADADGRAVAVWASRSEPTRDLQAAFGTVTAGLRSIKTVRRGGISSPQLAVDPGGAALATWKDPRPTIATAPPGGRFGTPHAVEDGPTTAPMVVSDGAGTFTAAWRTRDDAVHVLRRGAGSTSREVEEVDPGRAWRLALTVTAAHDTLLGWSLIGAHARDGVIDARVALGRPGGPLGHPLDLRTGSWGHTAFPNDFPRMAVDEDGGAFVWWRHPDRDGNDGYYGRFLFPPAGPR